jgi:hypothetical protein
VAGKGGKYKALKGKIPVQPSERDEAISAAIKEREGKSHTELMEELNALEPKIAEKAAELKALNTTYDALDIMIRERLEGLNVDGVKAHGFTWSKNVEPFPVVRAADVEQIVQYFRDNGMEDQLALKASEIAGRLKTFVKEEALAGEFEIEEVEVPDPETGGTKTISEVRSKIPGVRIFLSEKLSRTKS